MNETAEQKQWVAVATTMYDAMDHKKWDYQVNRKMTYKGAAAYASTVIKNPANWKYTPLGVSWRDGLDVTIYHMTYPLVRMLSYGQVEWEQSFVDATNAGPIMYIVAAMRNAVAEVRAEANREMTPAEIELEFGLKRGVVRKAIFDKQDHWIERGCIRKADSRTWLCKRHWALAKWGQK